MNFRSIWSVDPALLTASALDTVPRGGLVSYEHQKLTLLQLRQFVEVGSQPCAAFYDNSDQRLKLMKLCPVTNELHCFGSVSSLKGFSERDGMFWKKPTHTLKTAA